MNKITIANSTLVMLQQHALPGHVVVGGAQNSDGSWTIDVDDDVLAALKELHEDLDRAIYFACRGVGHG